MWQWLTSTKIFQKSSPFWVSTEQFTAMNMLQPLLWICFSRWKFAANILTFSDAKSGTVHTEKNYTYHFAPRQQNRRYIHEKLTKMPESPIQKQDQRWCQSNCASQGKFFLTREPNSSLNFHKEKPKELEKKPKQGRIVSYPSQRGQQTGKPWRIQQTAWRHQNFVCT